MTSKQEEAKISASKEKETENQTTTKQEVTNISNSKEEEKSVKKTPKEEKKIPTNVPTPSVFVTICKNEDLTKAMKNLDLELICTAEKVTRISDDDLFGYEAKGIYEKLYSLCQDGTGSAFHLWEDNHGVVLLGSEGERAKVSETCKDFLQIACSLAPHFMDAISSLPALNTLPDNGDINAAKEEDFDMELVVKSITQYLKDEPRPELREAANQILSAINLPRLTIRQALKKMIDAHLKEPRFSILPEEDDKDCAVFDHLASSDEEDD